MTKRLLICFVALFSSTVFGEMPTITSEMTSPSAPFQREGKIIETIEFPNPVAIQKIGFEWSLLGGKAIYDADYRATAEYYMAGTVSYFDHDVGIEYAVPFYYGHEIVDNAYRFRVATVDLHVRKFLFSNLDGFYISLFSRIAYLTGPLGPDKEDTGAFYGVRTLQVYDIGKEWKWGAGVGIGYRIFTDAGFYYGMSLSVGQYFIGRNLIFRNNHGLFPLFEINDNDRDGIGDIEFLKVGYAF